MANLRERVYLGNDDEIELAFEDVLPNGSALPKDLTVFTRFVLQLVLKSTLAVSATVDSADDASAFSTAKGSGRLALTLGKVLETDGLASGTYWGRLMGVDGSGDEHILCHEDDGQIRLEISVSPGVDA